MVVISPNVLVNSILENIVFEGDSGVLADYVWKFGAQALHEPLTEVHKNFIWMWISNETAKIDIFSGSEKITDALLWSQFVEKYGTDVKVVPTKDYYWCTLTGIEMTDELLDVLGEFNLQILKAVAKAREKGILNQDISKVTKQDARCITGRVDKLLDYNMVAKEFVLVKGKRHPVVVHRKFAKAQEQDNDGHFAGLEFRKKFVQAVKNGENGLRAMKDLRAQFGVTKDTIKVFSRTIYYLIRCQCLRRVKALEQNNRYAECLEYVKDYTSDLKAFKLMSSFQDNEENDDTRDEEADVLTESPLLNSLLTVNNQFLELLKLNPSGYTTRSLSIKVFGIEAARTVTNHIHQFVLKRLEQKSQDEINKYIDFYYRKDSIFAGVEFVGKVKLLKYMTTDSYRKTTSSEILVKPSLTFFSDNFISKYDPPVTFDDLENLFQLPALGSFSLFVDSHGSRYLHWKVDQIPIPNDRELLVSIGQQCNGKTVKKGTKRGRPKKIATDDTSAPVKKRGRPRKKKSEDLEPEAPVIDRLPPRKTRQKASLENNTSFVSGAFGNVGEELNRVLLAYDPLVQVINHGVENGKTAQPKLISVTDVPDVVMQEAESTSAIIANEAIQVSKEVAQETTENSKATVTASDAIDKLQPSKAVSFIKQRRLKAILRYLEANNGVAQKSSLMKYIENELSIQNLDRKTLNRDIETLVEEELVEIKLVNSTKLIVLKGKKVEDIDVAISKNLATLRPLRIVERNVRLYNIQPKELKKPLRKRKELPPMEDLPRAMLPSSYKANARSNKNDKTATGLAKVPVHKRAKRRRASETLKVNDFIEIKKEGMSYKASPASKKRNSKRQSGIMFRNENKLTREEVVRIYRSVLIFRSLHKDDFIKWDLVASWVDNPKLTEDILRKKWPHVRHQVGQASINKMTKLWSELLLKLVEEEVITVKDLEHPDFDFYLRLWVNNGIDGFGEKGESLLAVESFEEDIEYGNFERLYTSLKDSLDDKVFIPRWEAADNEDYYSSTKSMIQRENLILNKLFCYSKRSVKSSTSPLKQTLKSVFLTDSKLYSPDTAKKVFSDNGYSEEAVEIAIKELEASKEISLGSSHGKPKFFVNEKLINFGDSRVNQKFFQDAQIYGQLLYNAMEASKAVLISTVTSNGSMATIISNFVRDKLSILRVLKVRPKTDDIAVYSTKVHTDELLKCHLILSMVPNAMTEKTLPQIPIPIGKACSRVWIDVNGNINNKIFQKLIVTITMLIWLRPGITYSSAYSKMASQLTEEEFKELVDWLAQETVLVFKDFDSLFINDTFYALFSYV